MSVPNAPAVQQYVPAINPTLNGATYSGDPNGPSARIALAASTGNGSVIPLVANQPLSTLPVTTSMRINWTPVATNYTPTLLNAPASDTASILNADGSVYSGSPPPYVDRNTILTPQ